MSGIFLIVVLLVVFTGCSSNVTKYSSDDLGKKQLAQKFEITIKKEISIPYLIYLPKDYESRDILPLLFFFHGAGERGNDLELLKKHGPPKLIEEGKDFPFIIVSPQCPQNEWWTNEIEALNYLFDNIITNYKVDANRVYVTGLSMGGYATWAIATFAGDKIAAAIPICGGGDARQICRAGNLPIWAFHGAKDKVVPVDESQVLIEQLKKCGGNVKLTIYPDAEHDSWTETYNNQEIYNWLLEHKRDQRK